MTVMMLNKWMAIPPPWYVVTHNMHVCVTKMKLKWNWLDKVIWCSIQDGLEKHECPELVPYLWWGSAVKVVLWHLKSHAVTQDYLLLSCHCRGLGSVACESM
jgi:hypothetical protein